ncbi:MAG: hypothetical protein ACI9DC_000653 [Gammaproteobacteria bacterium]|jgi:hypothetical protein
MSALCSDAPTATATQSTQAPASGSPSFDSRDSVLGADARHESAVAKLGDADAVLTPALRTVLDRFGITLHLVAQGQPIPGTFWGEPEAGLIGTGLGAELYARADTPVHSALHEACHYICMDAERRAALHTNAGGTALEECGVCYLSIMLAGLLPNYGRARMLEDMDHWGYSFRLGSSAAWFEEDADDARQWLQAHALIDSEIRLTWDIRDSPRQRPLRQLLKQPGPGDC